MQPMFPGGNAHHPVDGVYLDSRWSKGIHYIIPHRSAGEEKYIICRYLS